MRYIRIRLKEGLLRLLVILRLFVLLQLLLSLECLLARLALVYNLAQLALALRLLLQYSLLLFEYLLRYRLECCDASLRVVYVVLTGNVHLIVQDAIELNSAGTAYDGLVFRSGVDHHFLFDRLGI